MSDILGFGVGLIDLGVVCFYFVYFVGKVICECDCIWIDYVMEWRLIWGRVGIGIKIERREK